MDGKVKVEGSVLSVSDLLRQQQLQQLQRQQLLAAASLPLPMDTSGPPHLHGNSLALGLAAEVQSASGVMPSASGASFAGRGRGVMQGMGSSSQHSQPGANLPHAHRLVHRGLKRPRDKPHGQDYYYRQWRRLKKNVKDFIFLNSSVCDEVIRVEEKLARVKEERRYLLRKLLQFQSLTDGATTDASSDSYPAGGAVKSSKSPASLLATPDHAHEAAAKKSTSKKKSTAAASSAGGDSKKKINSQAAKDILESLQSKPKKSKSQSNRRTIPPMQLDSLGRPVFPMMLGHLTLHSIGEIVPDRSSFNTHECIYPAGFCSTRVYASLTQPQDKCLYTCKISDCGDIPEFEIAPEEGTDQVFRGATPTHCLTQLLQAVNAAVGGDVISTTGSGADFFGLTNPVVQNLIQSCPGAKKCSGYRWIKFEINKAETNENVAVGNSDPTISVDAFHRLLQHAGGSKGATFSPPHEHATNLRSLLTKGSVPFSGAL
ncbi:transforming growth factor beta regulator 1-like [Littorina saxatilis]|uniref:Transforming growth factor beta regulator 1 n=1 Tax=Littorina saxatilis TaxID=31220 RepID=A0AAN9G2X0_9CAEN